MKLALHNTPSATLPDSLADNPATVELDPNVKRLLTKLGSTALIIGGVVGVGGGIAINQANADQPPAAIVVNADSEPHTGPGTPLFNADGYYLGRVKNGTYVRPMPGSSTAKYIPVMVQYNLSKHPVVQCAYIDSANVSNTTPSPLSQPCAPYVDDMHNRDAAGYGFNGAPHQYVDGAPIFVTPECKHKFYYNYFPTMKSFLNVNFPIGGSGFSWYAGQSSRLLFYRYVTEDGQAVEGRDPQLGFGYEDINCVNLTNGYPQGGAIKKPTTIPGANPNAMNQTSGPAATFTLTAPNTIQSSLPLR